jgi:hypothetical protein
MDKSLSTAQDTDSQANQTVAGSHPQACRRPAGRRPRQCIDIGLTTAAAAGTVRKVFPGLSGRFEALPDPRRQAMCRYSGSHIWWSGALMFLTHAGSRNAFDQTRNSGRAAYNMGAFCGQTADDPRFDDEPLITCTDNLAHHLKRVSSESVREIPIEMIEQLIKRRVLDSARLFGTWHVLIFDGTVQERCRKGFEQGGKSAGHAAPYRYVLQCGLLGPGATFLPFMHEHVDMHDLLADKEDCELTAFFRLSERIKQRFPRMRFCAVGDALFCASSVLDRCTEYGWKYVITLKEGRQPGLWEELLALLPLSRPNALRVWQGQDGKEGLRDFRWVSGLALGNHKVSTVLVGEMIPGGEATLYAYVTNFLITPDRVVDIIGSTGRERHLIEDYFNTEKNTGVGLGHVFCADATASKNLFSLMQVAAIIWTILYHGYLKRTFDWAARATQSALARAIAEGMRSYALPENLPCPGQLRFVT